MSRLSRSNFGTINRDTEDLSDLACGTVRKTLTPYCSSDKCCGYYRDRLNTKTGKMQILRERKVMVLKAGIKQKTRTCPDCSHSLKWVME